MSVKDDKNPPRPVSTSLSKMKIFPFALSKIIVSGWEISLQHYNGLSFDTNWLEQQKTGREKLKKNYLTAFEEWEIAVERKAAEWHKHDRTLLQF